MKACNTSCTADVVVCISGHLRNEAVSANALASIDAMVARTSGSTAAVLATWDVYGQRSVASKLHECYDMEQVPSAWLCPAFIARCEVLNFAAHYRVLNEAVRQLRSEFATNTSVAVEQQRKGVPTNGSVEQATRIASMYYLVARTFWIGLRTYPGATLFLRTRPDVKLLRPVRLELPASVDLECYGHMYWKGSMNDMTFLVNRRAAIRIATDATAWMGKHVYNMQIGGGKTAEGTLLRFVERSNLRWSIRPNTASMVGWTLLSLGNLSSEAKARHRGCTSVAQARLPRRADFIAVRKQLLESNEVPLAESAFTVRGRQGLAPSIMYGT